MVEYVLGTDLPPAAQRDAGNRYVYRMTTESVARWPTVYRQMIEGGYRLTLISDAQWLASTRFPITKRGTIANKPSHCEHDAYKFRTVIS